MNLVGVLIFWDESPSWLSACVSGFARVCDNIVAVDGAYRLLPGGRPRSLPDQAQAIQDACETAGVGCIIHRPKDTWQGNEVEKRQHSLELAGTLNPDWILVFDADYLVMLIDDPQYTRALIENSETNVITYTLLSSQDVLANEWLAEHAQANDIDSEWTYRDRGLFRYTPSLRYGPAHYCLRGTYDGVEQWLRGPDLSPGQQHKAAETEHLGRNLVAVHRTDKRAKVRAKAAKGYYEMRDQAGVEKITHETLYGPGTAPAVSPALILNGYRPAVGAHEVA